jgi:hypothetical protein
MINFGNPSQSQQGNVGMAVLAGLVVAIACAFVWGVIAYATKYQLSIMAILVGLAVGTVMARIGRVRTPAFGVASAVLAVFGCALGSLVAEILVINRADGAPLSLILAHLGDVFRVYPRGVGGLGFLFWAIAALYGYRIGTGGSWRWGWSRRVPRQPNGGMNQPYGTTNQPYGTMNQPYAPGQQPYGTPPGQPGDAPGQPYGAPPGFGGQQYGAPPAQPGDVTQQPPEFGFKQPPGTGQGQP